jgi:hypothetical protein
MTTPPYARLGVRVNGAAPQYGGITVAHGDMVQFVAESTAYWGTPAAVWQIFDYPDGWTGPGAPWVSLTVPQANGLPDAVVFQYTGNTAPPAFAMPALPYWGKFLPSLFVNGGTIQGKAAPQLYDESTAVQILSPSTLVEPAFRETSQFGSWRGFAGVLKALVRIIDGLFASVPSLSNATPQAVGTAAAGVAATASRSDHVHAHGNQLGGSLHADAGVSSGFMPASAVTKLAGIEAGADVTDFANVSAALAAASGSVSVNSQKITSLSTPAASTDAATKGYVDGSFGAAASTRFTSAGSYTIPPTCTMIRIAIQAPGGGGGGGATRGAGVAAGGGGAGGGGGYSEHIFHAATLLALGASIAYDPGTSGAAGAGATGVNGNGTAGTAGTDATATVGGTLVLSAGGGGGGAGGTTTGGAAGAGGYGQDVGGNGTAGTAGAGTPSPIDNATRAGAGGGGGGGLSAADVYSDGGDGGSSGPNWRGVVNGGAGGVDGGNGAVGGSVPDYPLGGAGGGGGGGLDTGNGGDGGDGGISGGGGGGGGGSRNGFAAGDGGAGRAGSIVIQVW